MDYFQECINGQWKKPVHEKKFEGLSYSFDDLSKSGNKMISPIRAADTATNVSKPK